MKLEKISAGRNYSTYRATVDERIFVFSIERGWTNRNPGRSSGYKGPCYYITATEWREPDAGKIGKVGETVYRGHVYDAPLRRAKTYIEHYLIHGTKFVTSY